MDYSLDQLDLEENTEHLVGEPVIQHSKDCNQQTIKNVQKHLTWESQGSKGESQQVYAKVNR